MNVQLSADNRSWSLRFKEPSRAPMDESRIQMPTLSGSRREKFGQEVAKGKSLSEAYRLVGYAPNPKNAQRLKSNESVKARIAELKARGAERAEVTIESLIDE